MHASVLNQLNATPNGRHTE